MVKVTILYERIGDALFHEGKVKRCFILIIIIIIIIIFI